MTTEAPPRQSTKDQPAPAAALLHLAERYALAVLLVLVVAFFCLWPKTGPVYIQPDNIRNIIEGSIKLWTPPEDID